ncbi:MAG: UvrD-helicase domain-containing protein [Planctomycetota bacterium]
MSQSRFSSLPHQVVRASAGAGKTYRLTTRYLGLLIRQEDPANILATTFTRKAAGEVLARVLGRLASACTDEHGRQQLADALQQDNLSRADCLRMLRSLTDGLNRLAVGTIDGFFNRAARAFAMDLGLPPDPRLIDEGSPLAQQMRFDAIQSVLGEEAENDGGMVTLIGMLRRLHHDTAQRSVTDAIDQIVKDLGDVYRGYPDPSLWGRLPDTGLLTNELVDAALEQLEAMRDRLPVNGKGRAYSGFRDRYEEIISDARRGHWDRVLANGLVVKVIGDAEKYGHAPISSAWHDAVRPLAVHARAARLKALADQTMATHKLLALFDRHYKETRYAQRVLLFSDLTDVLADGLPGMGEAGVDELSYRLDAKVTHLLLDEFQDTSLRQWAVLEPFAQQITDNFDDSRSLFCVGDTKQAIYGWRGGCAELFDAVGALPGVEGTTLSKSYRSSQVVLDAVNQVFTSLDGNAALKDCRVAAEHWQAGFETHHAVQAQLPGHVVLQTTAADTNSGTASASEEDAAAPPDAHAHYAAGHIRDLAQRLTDRTIGVLMRSRAKARTLMHALRALGIHAAEEGGNPISHTPAVAAVLAAIQLADHPGDSVARFHASNSPLGELLGLGGAADVSAVARGIRRSLMDRGYAPVIAGWAERLAPSCDAGSLRRLMQLIELAERFDDGDATLRPSFFVQTVQAAKVEDASPALVRVMTIHASKGLEFDAVVLPDLDGPLSGQDHRGLIVLDRDSPIEPVRGVYRRVSRELAGLTPELKRAHEQHAYEKRTEDLCLLYVAMTRARHSLHLLVRPLKQGVRSGKPTGKPTGTGLTNLSYAAILRQALRNEEGEGFEGDECLFESGSAGWGGADRSPPPMTQIPATPPEPIKLVSKPGHAARTWLKASPSEMHNQSRVSADELLSIAPSGGQHYGRVVHAMLEQVGFIDQGLPDAEALCAAGEPVGQSTIDLQQTARSLLESLGNPNTTALLQRGGADTLWRERRFMARLDRRLITGTFDRVHLWHDRNKPVRALLIDYKTDRIDDESIDAAVERYADQLGLYRLALASLLDIDPAAIETKLLFLGDDRVASVPSTAT